jgi:molybdenum cofactor guanylyltransferase
VAVLGVVLAGGLSRRFGEDKALALVEGVPMALRVASAIRAAGLEVVIAAPDSRLTSLGLPLLIEPDDGPRHPLRGLWAALGEADEVLCAPCDLPWLPAEAILALLHGPAPTVGFDGERVHPLLTRRRAADRPAVEALWRQGAPARALAQDARRVLLAASWLQNVNTRAALDPERGGL